MEAGVNSHVYRARPGLWIAMTCLAIFLVLFQWRLVYATDPLYVLPVSAGVMLLLLWLRVFQVRIDDDVVYYRSLRYGRVRLDRSNVRSARLEEGWLTTRDRFRPYTRIAVKQTNGVTIVVNARIFAPHVIAEIVRVLNQK